MVVHKTSSMAVPHNILVVSDLHFGEELLPGPRASAAMPWVLARAFHEFLQHPEARRLGGGRGGSSRADLFDLSVMIPGTRAHPARTHDERTYRPPAALHRRRALQQICENHRPLLRDLARLCSGGTSIDIIVGNHDIELMEPEVAAEFERQLRMLRRDGVERPHRAVVRLRARPGVDRARPYDEACSFEYSLSPCDPQDGQLMFNADYAATRYLAMTCPDRSARDRGVELLGLHALRPRCRHALVLADVGRVRAVLVVAGSRASRMTRSSGAIDAGARIDGCIAWLKTPALPSTR